MEIDVNTNLLDLPKLDDIQFDICYMQVPLSLFCKNLGISFDEFYRLNCIKNGD